MPEQVLPDPYDGLPIVKVTTALKGAGDGLSKALATGALKLHHGQRLIALIDVEVAGTTIKPLDKEEPRGPQQAKYELVASGRATFVDEALRADADALLDRQAKLNDELAGKPQLPLGDDPSVPSPGMAGAAPPEPDLPTDADGYADPELAKPNGDTAKATKPRKPRAKKAAASSAPPSDAA